MTMKIQLLEKQQISRRKKHFWQFPKIKSINPHIVPKAESHFIKISKLCVCVCKSHSLVCMSVPVLSLNPVPSPVNVQFSQLDSVSVIEMSIIIGYSLVKVDRSLNRLQNHCGTWAFNTQLSTKLVQWVVVMKCCQ